MNFTKIIDDSNNEQTKILFIFVCFYFAFALFLWSGSLIIRDHQHERIVHDIQVLQESIEEFQQSLKTEKYKTK